MQGCTWYSIEAVTQTDDVVGEKIRKKPTNSSKSKESPSLVISKRLTGFNSSLR
jgi:hypothetical protein